MEGSEDPAGAAPKLILDGALQAGLRAAFASVAGPRPEDSAITAVEVQSGAPARVMLRDPLDRSGATVLAPTPPGERDSKDVGRRYEVHGELAKGGIGVILKGRDTELGREVAIKVLRNRYAHDPDMLRRFVAEAQIGGQLQHPGILPVYDLGVRPDGRPFFTMKLMQGRTLAALLNARSEPSEDRMHLLTILVQVCQAVAYAHASGVVHRDLKPSNIMVGAFGEVQVLDWGLSKVLAGGGVVDDRRAGATSAGATQVEPVEAVTATAQSQTGSVMGTPAYMPPEQARGEVEQLDERSDVFSLGAILCEVLTGQPPYVGSTQESLRRQAAHAELEPALSKLAESGADAELVRIARSAMEPEQTARPRNAGVMAEMLSDFVASVDVHLRQAELARAAAEARAQSEGRARKLTAALAGVVLLVTLLGGGGYMLVDQQRRSRLATTSRAVEQALGQARLHEGQALAAAGNALPSWDLALEAVRRAQAAATTGEADAATHSEVTALLSAFTSARETASSRQARAQADRQVLAELRRIREAGLEDSDYTRAFQEYGIDIDALTPSEAANAIRRAAIGLELTSFLDPWSTTRMFERNDKSEHWRRLLEVALLADDDAWRSQLREAVGQRDRVALLELVRSAPVEELPAVTLHLMGKTLANVDEHAATVELLTRAQRRFPQDYQINRTLAFSLEHLSPPRWQAAALYHSTAVGRSPTSRHARVDLSIALRKAGDPESARMWLDSALAIGEQHVSYLYLAGRLGNDLAEFDLGLEAIEMALEAKPESAEAWGRKALLLSSNGDLEGALSAHEMALELDPSPSNYNNVGVSLMGLNRMGEAQAAYQAGIQANPNDYLLHSNLGALLLRLPGEANTALAELRRSAELNPFVPTTHYLLGGALEQENRWPEAVQEYREAIRLQGEVENHIVPHCYNSIGIWHYNNRELEEATANFRKVIEICETALAQPEFLACQKEGLADGHFNLGNTQKLGGQVQDAIHSYRTTIGVEPTHFRAHNALADLLLDQHDVEEALVSYRAALALQPTNVLYLDGLGWGLVRDSRYVEAIPYLRGACAARPDDPRLSWNLALALKESGRYGEARELYLDLLEENEDIEEMTEKIGASFEACTRLLELDARLAQVVSGKQAPANPAETVEFAKVAATKELYGTSAKLWLAAFAASPKLTGDPLSEDLYHAVCALAQAGCSLGKDADSFDAETRTAWRRQAYDWLSAQLEGYRTQLAGADQEEREQAIDQLKHWKHDRFLDGVHDEAHLEKLPEGEQVEWRSFWVAAMGLLAEATR